MNTPKLIAETAFRLHKEKQLSRKDMVNILEDCINLAAIDNGYAEANGLPFPQHRRRRHRGGARRGP